MGLWNPHIDCVLRMMLVFFFVHLFSCKRHCSLHVQYLFLVIFIVATYCILVTCLLVFNFVIGSVPQRPDSEAGDRLCKRGWVKETSVQQVRLIRSASSSQTLHRSQLAISSCLKLCYSWGQTFTYCTLRLKLFNLSFFMSPNISSGKSVKASFWLANGIMRN